MGNRYNDRGTGVLNKKVVEKPVANSAVVQYNDVEETKPLRSIYPAKLNITGPVSGKQYVWENAGSVVSVNIEDYDPLLAKRVGGKGCCGADNLDGNKLFEAVGG